MGLSLIASLLATSLADLGNLLLVILEVGFALGTVIFVHELGHFAVAKWCGVKCEKFYLGFDIYGLKLFKRQWGETEYGIGILPLGGYVKMLGQDDNPARAAEERERSKIHADGPAPVHVEQDSEQLDPRSYLAKSVPQRMAIISAGVVMNVIFAFLFAVAAFGLGVPETACGVSAVRPGEPAWRANIQPGDQIVQINDSDGPLRFRDLMSAVALGDLSAGVEFKIERAGVDEPILLNVKPDKVGSRLVPTIGVAPPFSTTLDRNPIVYGGTPAAEIDAFQVGDTITAVGDVPVKTYPDVEAQFVRHVDEPLSLTIERKTGDSKEDPDAVKILQVTVPPRPMRTLGLVMTMGQITAIQDDSPAAKAGLRPGDLIESIDGNSPGDPLRLPQELLRRAGETVKLVVKRPTRGGESETLEKEIELRDRPWPEESSSEGNAVSVPALGLTYQVLATVDEVVADSPAAKATLTKDGKPAGTFAPGDVIAEAKFEKMELSEAEQQAHQDKRLAWWSVSDPIEFSADEANWPFFMFLLQQLPQAKVTLTLADGRQATLVPADSQDWHYFNRGLKFGPEMATIKAHTFAQAVSLGGRETLDSLLMVYKFLQRLGTNQVSPYSVGGPVTIFQAAAGAAKEGVPTLLLFLTMLSANLAVINFLPIPLLDGGHMVFLILEGIQRRPVNEKVVIAFHYAGFVFIISLMLFVLSLDFGLIPRF